MRNILDTLVTGRTQADVDRAREMDRKGWAAMTAAEKTEFLNGPWGAYTRHDMNRVTGALAYLESLMNRTGATGSYEPIPIRHVTAGGTWTDTVWIDEDKPRPSQWAAYLANVERYWDYVCRITAAVLPRWDPDGNGYIKPGRSMSAGDVCAVTDCCGLLELSAEIACPPGAVSVSGTAWSVERGDGGYTAAYRYLEGPFPDIKDALDALELTGTDGENVVDVTLSFSAQLRRGGRVELGVCAVRWSPFRTWAEFGAAWGVWGGAEGRSWDSAIKGGDGG